MYIGIQMKDRLRKRSPDWANDIINIGCNKLLINHSNLDVAQNPNIPHCIIICQKSLGSLHANLNMEYRGLEMTNRQHGGNACNFMNECRLRNLPSPRAASAGISEREIFQKGRFTPRQSLEQKVLSWANIFSVRYICTNYHKGRSNISRYYL